MWAAVLLLAIAATLATYAHVEQSGYSELAQMAMHQLDLYGAGIESELSKYERLPRMLELDQDLFQLLDRAHDAALRDKVNKALLNLNVRAGSLAILLLDHWGVVQATSNWYEPDSFLGWNMFNAPFFAEAVVGGRARTFVGDVSQRAPYCFLAHPMRRGGRVVGVVAVKVSLATMESTWIAYAASSRSEKLLVIDENGVVVMSSNPALRYRTLSPKSAAERELLASTGRYPLATLEPLGVEVERVLHGGARLVRLPTPGRPGAVARFLSEEQTISRPDWKLMTLSDVGPVRREARNAALGAAGAAGLLALLAMHLLLRRHALRQQLAARRALQRANDELEFRVQERTAELRSANVALEAEVVERKRTEQTLRETQAELVRSGRLALLGQMSAAITHEINQPLTALRALSDNSRRLLSAGRVSNVERNLKKIADLTERMGRITAQLKSFARKTPVQNFSTPLCGAISNALELMRARISSEDVEVRIDMPEGLRVLCDGYRLEQVLINLFGNALDAMKLSQKKVLTIAGELSDTHVRIRVADTGTGLQEQVLSHLFEPFFSTKPPGEGLGLGLLISGGIVQEFGSSLRAMNHAEGAAFEFDLQLERESIDVV